MPILPVDGDQHPVIHPDVPRCRPAQHPDPCLCHPAGRELRRLRQFRRTQSDRQLADPLAYRGTPVRRTHRRHSDRCLTGRGPCCRGIARWCPGRRGDPARRHLAVVPGQRLVRLSDGGAFGARVVRYGGLRRNSLDESTHQHGGQRERSPSASMLPLLPLHYPHPLVLRSARTCCRTAAAACRVVRRHQPAVPLAGTVVGASARPFANCWICPWSSAP
jgi:hypothetical protein